MRILADISGKYGTNFTVRKFSPSAPGDPPYTAAAMATYKENMAAVKKPNTLDDKARKVCTRMAVPRISGKSLSVRDRAESRPRRKIHIIYELNHVIRLLR